MNNRNSSLQIFLGFSLGLETIYIIMSLFENLRAHIPIYLICYGIAYIIYWVAALLFFDLKNRSQFSKKMGTNKEARSNGGIHWLTKFIKKQKMQESLSTKEVLIVGILFGVIFRLTLLFSPPSLSD
ncbi:MAG: hypothetical protein ACE5JB_12525, partial [bacterium]